jgi:hypothetical protein
MADGINRQRYHTEMLKTTYRETVFFNVFFNIRISRKLILTKQRASTQAVAQSTAYDGSQPRHEQPGEPKAS